MPGAFDTLSLFHSYCPATQKAWEWVKVPATELADRAYWRAYRELAMERGNTAPTKEL